MIYIYKLYTIVSLYTTNKKRWNGLIKIGSSDRIQTYTDAGMG